MPITPEHETELLEALSEAESAHECLLIAYDVLDDTVDALLKSILFKDDYAVKFVVDPLLTNDGPLGEILVRTKLLLGLGSISKEVYDDIDIFVTLREWAKFQGDKVSFTEVDVLFELNKINAVKTLIPLEFNASLTEGMSGATLDMFLSRHFQRVRSTLVLAVTDIVAQLCRENDLTS
ncbi:transcriptional regulator [Vibrio sp. UCD-FRSSP16_10]|uniref:MltR family transcriptional regulator n=1 Tax=unclassified Vibrio TaxID=2614977 RepID=UPI0007FDABAA|nr:MULTISPECIES: MltR family transcriptional regulator [unclassified Vibrio]OBT17475.1 transcriptional regulator [Vibrio sp. UCD-FRSSP16_30]OBT23244.1 transcriptional regulator [Vibrio sp. UCD-FRSSP16_10]